MRRFVSFLLLLVACVLLPLTIAATWLRNDVTPADAYVASVAPLADDPSVRTAVENRTVTATMRALDARVRLPKVARDRVEQQLRTAVSAAVASDAFAEAWRTANRSAHAEVIAILSGDTARTDVHRGGKVEVRIDALTPAVRRQLAAAGVPGTRALPPVRASIPVGDVQELQRARVAYSVLDAGGLVLPIVTIALLVVGLAVARRSSRAVALTGMGAVVAVGLLAVGLFMARAAYLRLLPAVVPEDAGAAFFDAVTEALRRDIAIVGVAAVAVLAVATIASSVTPNRR